MATKARVTLKEGFRFYKIDNTFQDVRFGDEFDVGQMLQRDRDARLVAKHMEILGTDPTDTKADARAVADAKAEADAKRITNEAAINAEKAAADAHYEAEKASVGKPPVERAAAIKAAVEGATAKPTGKTADQAAADADKAAADARAEKSKK